MENILQRRDWILSVGNQLYRYQEIISEIRVEGYSEVIDLTKDEIIEEIVDLTIDGLSEEEETDMNDPISYSPISAEDYSDTQTDDEHSPKSTEDNWLTKVEYDSDAMTEAPSPIRAREDVLVSNISVYQNLPHT